MNIENLKEKIEMDVYYKFLHFQLKLSTVVKYALMQWNQLISKMFSNVLKKIFLYYSIFKKKSTVLIF